MRSTDLPFLSKSVDFNRSRKLPSACDVLLCLPWKISLEDPTLLAQGNQEPRFPKIDGRASGSGFNVEAIDSFRISFGDVKECKFVDVYWSVSKTETLSMFVAVEVWGRAGSLIKEVGERT